VLCLDRRKPRGETIIQRDLFVVSAKPLQSGPTIFTVGAVGVNHALNTAPAADTKALLRAWSGGDQSARDQLTPIVYDELRRLARYYMGREHTGNRLQATALVNEAYPGLVDSPMCAGKPRALFAVSAQLMRRIPVDHARHHNLKRGAGVQHVDLEDPAIVGGGDKNLVVLDEALRALARFGPRKAQVVELRFFGGLRVEETAEILKVSALTVMHNWSTARAWLYREINGGPHDGR
jgi:RNA polymerase sigma factor (TIGR02999 family)